jgi:hypothetical protein
MSTHSSQPAHSARDRDECEDAIDTYKYTDECVLIVLERVSRSAGGGGGGEGGILCRH